ncbi:MAG: hypothetical protein R3Y57_07080, partial [Erysipelotrichaceae bacterium]
VYFFVWSCFVAFLLPSVVLLQILYFKYFKNNSYLPILLFIIFYPLYITLFYGKVDSCGFFFLLLGFMLVILPDFNMIKTRDNLFINLCGFLMVFLRRWYLYPLIGLYLAYFVKYLFYYHFKPFTKEAFKDFMKIISSGIILLCCVLIFFQPYLLNLFETADAEAFAFWSRDDKLHDFINFYSPIICIISIYGGWVLVKVHKQGELFILLLVASLIPYIMFIQMQSLEQHHYFITNLLLVILFSIGILHIFTKIKYIGCFILILLSIQSLQIFLPTTTLSIFTSLKKEPFVHEDKEAILDFSNELKSLMMDWEYTYMATGTYLFSDDIIRNALLPDLTEINLISAVLDTRDGFPSNFEYVRYVVLSEPTLYLGDAEYQQMYDVIKEAILHEPLFEGIYQPVYTCEIIDAEVTIYQRVEDLTAEHMQYFYDEMLKLYPDKESFFAHILLD